MCMSWFYSFIFILTNDFSLMTKRWETHHVLVLTFSETIVKRFGFDYTKEVRKPIKSNNFAGSSEVGGYTYQVPSIHTQVNPLEKERSTRLVTVDVSHISTLQGSFYYSLFICKNHETSASSLVINTQTWRHSNLALCYYLCWSLTLISCQQFPTYKCLCVFHRNESMNNHSASILDQNDGMGGGESPYRNHWNINLELACLNK